MFEIEQEGMREFHFVQQSEGGADVGAVDKGAASAINDDGDIFGNSFELLPPFVQIRGIPGRAGKDGAFDDGAGAYAKDQWLLGFGVFQGFGEVGGR